jgi:hypothetical protein
MCPINSLVQESRSSLFRMINNHLDKLPSFFEKYLIFPSFSSISSSKPLHPIISFSSLSLLCVLLFFFHCCVIPHVPSILYCSSLFFLFSHVFILLSSSLSLLVFFIIPAGVTYILPFTVHRGGYLVSPCQFFNRPFLSTNLNYEQSLTIPTTSVTSFNGHVVFT